MALFAPFQVRVDPWEVDYGGQTPLGSFAPEDDDDVDAAVDVPPAEWQAVTPPVGPLPPRIFFVDGVRRLDTRLQVRHNGSLLHGAFGSFAIGFVQVTAGTATFGDMQAGRLLVFGSGHKPAHDVPVRGSLVYRAEAAKEAKPEAPLRHIQDSMRSTEGLLARRLTEASDALVVADGPLTFAEHGPGQVVGYIKQIMQLYLPAELHPMIAALPAESRTPLFALRKKLPRLAWYVRLAAPRATESDFHGLVRLEVQASMGLPAARALADLTCRLLPRFAPPRARDPRAPQNLLPISALEQRLRRELGDALLLRRWIEELVAREVAHA